METFLHLFLWCFVCGFLTLALVWPLLWLLHVFDVPRWLAEAKLWRWR